MKRKHPEVPGKIIAKLRSTCMALPEAYEETAWVGTRWLVRKKTFAHVLMIDAAWPPAYVKAAGTEGPACVLTFRFQDPGVDLDRFTQRPYFKPVWWPNIVGLFLDGKIDWASVEDHVVGSYRLLAPQKLVDEIGKARR